MAELDVTKIVEEIAIKARETEEAFIFETVKPYCEYITGMEITKEDLKEALLLRQNYENRLKADMVAMLTEIQVEIEEVSEVNDYDFRIYKEGIDDCMKIIQAKINVLKGVEDRNAE